MFTPFADLDAVLGSLTAGLRATLGDLLDAVYLQGSFAVGDFDEHSDVDFVVVVREPLDTARVAALQVLHGATFDLACPWAQHLEGSYFPRAVIRTCERRGEELWYLDNGARSLIRSGHCNTAVVRHTVREHGIRVLGPPPSALVDAVPVGVLRAEIYATMRDWGAEILADPDRWKNRFYQGFITLNYCRMWRDLTDGTVGSKRRGAEWAKARLGPRWVDLIDRAWATRPDPAASVRTPADEEDYARTLELLRMVLDECGRLAREEGLAG